MYVHVAIHIHTLTSETKAISRHLAGTRLVYKFVHSGGYQITLNINTYTNIYIYIHIRKEGLKTRHATNYYYIFMLFCCKFVGAEGVTSGKQ